MNIIEAHGIAMWRLESIHQILAGFLTAGEGEKNPSLWAMNTLGQIIGIMDLSDAQVVERIRDAAT